tara:strand:- start:149 stop:475 length:327 start_codon:yes stop_codon:yes gene_type:complete
MNDIQEIDAPTLKKQIDSHADIELIDVREEYEVEICKIKDSTHIPMNQIPNHLNDLDNKKKLIIICKSGVRSYHVCQFLHQEGFKNIYNLKGGIINWALEIDNSLELY